MSEALSSYYEPGDSRLFDTVYHSAKVLEVVPDIDEVDAVRMHGLIGAAVLEHEGTVVGMDWALDYAVTHPHVLARSLHELPLIQRSWAVDITANTAFRPDHVDNRTGKVGMLALAHDIHQSFMPWRISANPHAIHTAHVSDDARAALEASLSFRTARANYYTASNDPVAFRLMQNRLLSNVARYAIGQDTE